MVQIRRVGIKRLKQILKLKKGGEEMIEHITKSNEEKNNKSLSGLDINWNWCWLGLALIVLCINWTCH